MITRQNFTTLATHNFTGRNDPTIYNLNFHPITMELGKYGDAVDLLDLLTPYDIRNTAQQYLDLAEGI